MRARRSHPGALGPASPVEPASSRAARTRVLTLLLFLLLPACAHSSSDPVLAPLAAAGRYPEARERLEQRIAKSRDAENRDYVLDRVRLGMVELADGQVDAAETPFLAAYDLLRVQGLNDDRTVRALVGTESGAITWKGEPFEQAAAYAYFAAQLASVSDWGNVHAAAQQSLFLLADFGTGPDGSELSYEQVYRETDEDELDEGYQPIETNFAPGYFMAGLGDWGRRGLDPGFEASARDNFRKAVAYAPALEPVVDALTGGRANSVFWVDFGEGPEKVREGEHGEISRYLARTRSDDAPLIAKVKGGERVEAGVAADFNDYAHDHRWRAREDLRRAKAAVGELLANSGVVVAATADNDTGRLVGLGMIIAGMVTSSNAGADTRHNELLPQRSYFVALDIDEPDSTVMLQVAGRPGSRLVLSAIDPPRAPETVQFRYVRLNDLPETPVWAASGEVLYANEFYGARVPGDGLPYIMGGRCVRSPTPETLARYKAAGHLLDLTTNDLKNLYRDEGITLEVGEQAGGGARHVLEGGTSLVSPLPGTAGYARVYCAEHGAYIPRSDALRRAIAHEQEVSR